MRSMFFTKRILLGTVLLVSLSCTHRPECNLLLITLDTTRADHLGCYGHVSARTPVIDSLAAEGVLFTRCWTPVPVTLPSHATMFTGLLPIAHGVRDNGLYRLEAEAQTLAEILEDSGMETAAFVGAYVLASRYGLAQGFRTYDERFGGDERSPAAFITERKADKVTDAAIEFFRARRSSRPFAVWLHYFDPHAPMNPPAPYDSIFAGAPYDGEIAFMDRELGRFLLYLKEQGLFENTLIVVAADHGEGLGEHGEPTHGIFLYNSTVHVPLIIRLPQAAHAGTTCGCNVSLVDLMPTVLDYLGLKARSGLQGRSLMPLVTDPGGARADSVRNFYLETYLPTNTFGWHHLEGMLRGELKYIEAPVPELYDLSADPEEKENLALADSVLLRRMGNLYLVWKRTLGEKEGRKLSGEVSLDSQSAERLRALGYISGSLSARPEASRPDPKTMIRTLGTFMEGVMAEAEGDYDGALGQFDSVLKADPKNTYAMLFSGFVSLRLERFGRALDFFQRAVAVQPDCAGNFFLGRTYLQLDSLVSARRWLERTVELDPAHPRAHFLLAEVMLRLGQADSALSLMETARSLAPGDKEILNDLGKMLLDRGETDLASARFAEALAVDSLYPLALYNQGIALYRLDKPEEAEKVLRRVAERFSGDPKVQNNLGVVLFARGDLEGARRAYEKAIAADSAFAPAHSNLGNLYVRQGQTGLAEQAYLTSIRLDSTYAEGHLNLGLLYKDKPEEHRKARLHLERAVELDSLASWTPRVREILREMEP